jgi:hypothetical protein
LGTALSPRGAPAQLEGTFFFSVSVTLGERPVSPKVPLMAPEVSRRSSSSSICWSASDARFWQAGTPPTYGIFHRLVKTPLPVKVRDQRGWTAIVTLSLQTDMW